MRMVREKYPLLRLAVYGCYIVIDVLRAEAGMRRCRTDADAASAYHAFSWSF